MTASAVRAVRNANPCNIRVGDPWQGLMPADMMNDEQKAEKEFCVFQAPKWGFRAAARVLISYQDKHQVETIRAAITRWAPPSENDTEAYIAHVVDVAMIGADEPVDFHSYADVLPIVKAMSIRECGKWLFDDKDDLSAGLTLAGLEPPVEKLAQSRTIQTAGAATASVATIEVITQTAQQLQPAVSFVKDLHTWAPTVAIALLVIALGAVVCFRIDDFLRAKR